MNVWCLTLIPFKWLYMYYGYKIALIISRVCQTSMSLDCSIVNNPLFDWSCLGRKIQYWVNGNWTFLYKIEHINAMLMKIGRRGISYIYSICFLFAWCNIHRLCNTRYPFENIHVLYVGSRFNLHVIGGVLYSIRFYKDDTSFSFIHWPKM